MDGKTATLLAHRGYLMARKSRRDKIKLRRDFSNAEIAAIADFLLDRGAYFLRGAQAFEHIPANQRNEYESSMYSHYMKSVENISYMISTLRRDPQNVQDLIAHYRRTQQSQSSQT